MENDPAAKREGQRERMVQQHMGNAPAGCPSVCTPLDGSAIGVEQEVRDTGESKEIAVLDPTGTHPRPSPSSDSQQPPLGERKL
jgi:hypothetical protein